MLKWKVGVYLRLSNDDKDKSESNSITNQRNLINLFIKKEKDIKIKDYYIDDGYSGLNLKRPMLEKMVGEIKKGNINEILVSDYARISRNILELDDFVSKYLIPRNIKLISVREDNDFYNIQKEMKNYFLKRIVYTKGKKYNGR